MESRNLKTKFLKNEKFKMFLVDQENFIQKLMLEFIIFLKIYQIECNELYQKFRQFRFR